MTPYAESISSLTRESAPQRRFLNALFRLLDHHAVCYCVLHSYDALPERISTDLDIAVHQNDAAKLPLVVGALAQEGYRPVQCFNYAVGAYYFVFAWTEDSRILFVAVDVILNHRRRGLMLASGRELVAGRRTLRNFYVPNPAVEFSYLISKKTLKGDMGHRQEQRLKVLAAELGEHRTEQLARELFGKEWAPRVVRLCIEGNASSIPGKLQRRLWWNVFMRRPFASAGGLVPEAVRLIRRWRHRTGFFIAVLGPDGTGKSTLLNEITRTFLPAFRSVRRFHWRPGLVWRTNTTAVTDPHGRPRRGTWASLPRLGAWLADFFIGYWAIMRPGLARGRFIVFDRYFDDLYADPRRYRYGGPSWLVLFCRRIRPEPDLAIVMDAPEAVLISRKAEVAPDEITRQRRAYAELSAGFRDSVVVDASRPSDEVAIRVSREILSRLTLRFPALYPSAPRSGEVIRQAMSQFAGTECIFAPPEDKRRTLVLHAGERRPAPDLPGLHYGFAALPSRKNPRWLVPLGNTGAALAAMEIYSPYKFPARLFKRCLMTAISSRVPVWERDRVLLDCERPLQLEALVAQITGEPGPFSAFLSAKTPVSLSSRFRRCGLGGKFWATLNFP